MKTYKLTVTACELWVRLSISTAHEILTECTYMEKPVSLRSPTEPGQGLQVVSHWMP
jgi:hypothetical protein